MFVKTILIASISCFSLIFHLYAHEINSDPPLLLVTGCARSGTGYIAKFLQESGLEFGHEYLKKDGLSCWLWTFDTVGDTAWFKPRKGLMFKHIFHQVRHPLKVITSLSLTDPPGSDTTWGYIQRQIPQIYEYDSHIIKCAKYWYYWNLEAEKIAEWTYQVEELELNLHLFERKLGVSLDPDLLKRISKKTNTRMEIEKYLSWDDLKNQLEPELFYSIISLAKKYGYKVPEDLFQ